MQKKKMLIHVLFHIIPWEFLKTIFFLGKGGGKLHLQYNSSSIITLNTEETKSLRPYYPEQWIWSAKSKKNIAADLEPSNFKARQVWRIRFHWKSKGTKYPWNQI